MDAVAEATEKREERVRELEGGGEPPHRAQPLPVVPEPQPEPEARVRELEGGGEPQPEPEAQTLRDRLKSARGGSRVERYDEVFADRRRERYRDPQILEDDVYRAKQRVAAAMVFNQYSGVKSAPPRLTGEGHNNPTVEASGGFMGTTFSGPLHQAPRPMARSPYTGRFGFVDTGKEIRDSTRD